jgi:PAS domain S-box-containing protein
MAYSLRVPPEYAASFWPATPLLVTLLLLVPRKIWPVLITAGLGAMAFGDFKNGVPIATIIFFSLGDLAAVLVATLGISRLFEGVPHLISVKTLVKYSVVAVILAPFVSAFLGAISSPRGGYWLTWRLWVFSDSMAFLTVTPAILNWFHEGRAWARKSHNYLEFAALMTSLVFLGYLTFMRTGRGDRPVMLYSLVPLLLWAALRFGLKGVSTSLVVVALLSIWGAAHGRGPFTGEEPLNNVLSLQLFLIFTSIPFTVLAVLVEEQKRAQQALIEEGAQLTEAQQLAQVGSWQWDPNTDAVTWSREPYRITGRDPNLPAATYKEHSQLLTAESWERLQRSVEEALRSGTPYELDLEYVRPDGSTIWARARGEAQHDITGQIVGLRGTAQDITERRLAERELVLANDRLRLAMESGKTVGWDRDVKSGRETWFGDLQSMFGIASEVYDGRVADFHRYLHPDDRGRVLEANKDAMESQKPYAVEFRILWPDGTVRWVAARGKFYYSPEGEPERMLGMSVDFTEHKLAKDALSKVGGRLIEAHEEERTWIARELHDDIGQQLALLANNLALMEQDPPDSAAEIHNRTHEHLKRVREIAADTQAMSHRLHSSKLRLLGIVAAVKSFCRELSEQHKVEIDFTHTDIPPTVPEEISLCLFRVMQEALHNAVKHSGVRHIEVELHGAPDGIDLTVRDAGVGFDPEALANNRGLGLVSMQERVNLVKGTFSIDSRPGHGTTIHVRVPLSTRGESARAAVNSVLHQG